MCSFPFDQWKSQVTPIPRPISDHQDVDQQPYSKSSMRPCCSTIWEKPIQARAPRQALLCRLRLFFLPHDLSPTLLLSPASPY